MKQKQKHTMGKRIVLGIVFFTIVAISATGIWYMSLTKVAMPEIVVKERGLDGHGQLFVETVLDEEMSPEIQAKIEKAGGVNFQLSRSEGVFNGDEVKITPQYNKIAFLKNGLRVTGAQEQQYTAHNLLVTQTAWEDLPGKDQINEIVTNFGEQFKADYLAGLQQAAAESLGTVPNIWIDFDFEQLYYGFNNSGFMCDLPVDPQGFSDEGASFDYCDQALIVFKVHQHVEAPYYYEDDVPHYAYFTLGGIYLQDEELVMGDIYYHDDTPLFHVRSYDSYQDQLKYHPHFQPVEF